MHRATPIQASFRGYRSGGARTVIDKADDSKLMQEMGGNFMKGETRQKVESPQNYGFTSVVMDADKGQDGQISGSAEGFISFMGGNRSFPVCTVMDDRRRLLVRAAGQDRAHAARRQVAAARPAAERPTTRPAERPGRPAETDRA